MSRIVILESLGIPPEELAACKRPFEEAGHTFAEYERTGQIPALIERACGADAVILANMPLPGRVIAACGRLRFIDVAFTGVDHVDLAAARAAGITVSNASGYSDQAVAELVLGMALSLARRLPAAEARCRAGGTRDGLTGWQLQGKTVGIVGLGRIGTRTAQLFRAFGCTVLAHSRTRHSGAPAGVEQVGLEELLRRADIVTLHCPLNDSTRGMIDAGRLALMKPTALLINAARGPVVVARDLADALERGVIAGAGVDVFDREPPLDGSEPLLRAKNCLVTPHVAFATREAMSLRAQIVFDNLRAWLEGRPQNLVC